jgi:hypothetical protein
MIPQFVDAPVVEPVQDWAALENARLVNQARADLLRSGSAVTVEAVARVTGKSPATVRRWVARQRADGRLVTVSHEGQVHIPTVQLTPAFDDIDVLAGAAVAALVEHGLDGWSVWDWFMVPNTWLGGATPASAVAARDRAGLTSAVSGLLQE